MSLPVQKPGVAQAASSAPPNGFAVVNHSAMPVLMMKALSINPISRNTLPCSSFISSGWRPEASRNLAAITPTPRPEPMAAMPMRWATASGSTSTPFMSVLRWRCRSPGRGTR